MKQERGTGCRRWFEADGLDLVVWYDAGGALTGFQVCYDLGYGEQAVTWRPGWGFTHSIVDSEEGSPCKNKTSVLRLPDGSPPWTEIARRFDDESGTLPPELRQLVHDKLAEKAGANAG